MFNNIGSDDFERDWRALRIVAAALLTTAGLAFLLTYNAVPRDDIVLLGSTPSGSIEAKAPPITKGARLHLAGSAAH